MSRGGVVEVGSATWFAIAEEQERRIADRLKGGGGDGTSGGVTDDWKASVDRQLAQLHDDARRAESRLAAAAIALAAMIAGLYLYTNEKFDRVGQRLSGIEVQQARIDAKLDRLIERIPASRR